MADEPARRGPELTAVAATALVVANMIGTGIFTTTGFLAGALGDPWAVLGVWVVGGLLALCGAFVYGELGAMLPRAGGEYVYLTRAFHPALGFLSGWISLLVGFSAPVAAAAFAFGIYVHAAVPAVGAQAAGVAVIVAMSAMHMADVLWGSRVQTVLSAYKVALIVGFVIAALAVGDGDWSHLSAPSTEVSVSGLAVALIFVSFSYSGWNAAAYIAGELREPGRTLPRALIGGTCIVLVLYLALNVVFFYGAPAAALAASPEQVGHTAARGLFGGVGGATFSLLVAVGLMSTVSAMTMAGPRVYMAMAEDGLCFRALARRSRGGAPWASVAAQSAIAIAMLLTATFMDLLIYIGFTLSLSSAFTVVGAFVLRRREPALPRPYRVPGWPLTPLVFLGLSCWMAVYAVVERPIVALAGGATIATGLLLYVAWRRFAADPG